MTSRGQVMIKIGHVAYVWMRLDERDSFRGEWAWFGRQDSPGNSNISKMHKDRNAIFNVHFQPRPMHVSSHNMFGLISSFSCHSTISFFGICGIIFQSANRAADDFKTYQFVLPFDQGPENGMDWINPLDS